MHDWLIHVLKSPLVYAVGVSMWTAVKADYEAFETWNDPAQAVAYNWKLVRWRAFKALVRGVVGYFTGAGIVSLIQ